MSTNTTQVVKDLKEKSILVSREFNAPVALVWSAFTDSEILDQWWGPAPWRAETKFQDFSVGGYWLYAMVSTGFQNAGIEMGPDLPPPSQVPDGVIALVGYVNRLLIVVDILWLIFVARAIKRITNTYLSN